jgi:hypothetical protein
LEALFLLPNPTRKTPYYLPAKRSSQRQSWDRALDVVSFLHESIEYEGYAFLPFDYTSQESKIVGFDDEEKYDLQLLRDRENIFFLTSKRVPGNRSVTINNKEYKPFAQTYLTSAYISSSYDLPWMKETLLVSASLLRLGFEYLKDNWVTIVNSGFLMDIAKDASSLSVDKYVDFTLEPFLGSRLELQAYFRSGKRIRIGDIGEGIKNYIIARILYEATDPAVLLWDDIESHLNPRILLHLAEWFSRLLDKGRQIVVSTHSLEAARLIAGVNEEQSRIYITSLEKSTLKSKKLTLEELDTIKKAGIDPRTAEAILL